MTLEEIKSDESASLMSTYGRFPVALDHGRGATAVDVDGKEYIDFGSGIGVNALGYCEPGWAQAVAEQAARLQHTSNLYYNPVQVAFAKELCQAAHMGRAFLCNSGAEANECAIKLARKYSFDKYGKGRSKILTLVNSFHGRTVTTLAATGQEVFHNYFFPFTGDFGYVPAGDAAELADAMDDTVCAVMLECVQGEGGVIALDFEYLRQVRELCSRRDVLLIVDEVQTGAGRTGKFLACEHAGILPDVVTMAKGLGGGLPIGACLCSEALAGVLSAGMHGSTFGGNPVVCAAGRYMLQRLTAPGFLAEVTEKGAYIRSRLAAMPHVKELRGLGMMIGVRLDTEQDPVRGARAVAEKCLENGLLILTAKTLLRLLPPLNITKEELDKGLDALQTALESL
jgi:acetylornithine/N-succinyldiaminopimelate aminotransferase